jgi:hypothetical protein
MRSNNGREEVDGFQNRDVICVEGVSRCSIISKGGRRSES